MEYFLVVNIICLVGILFISHFIYLFILSRNTQKWLPIKGKINKSKLEITNQDIGNDMSVSYKAKIEYQYVIADNTYFSQRIFIGDYIKRNFSRSVESLINKYAKNKEVLVYYNSNNPKCSVLETGVHSVIYRELFIGILFVVISIVMKVEEPFFVSLIQ
jgi:hypothetical protein